MSDSKTLFIGRTVYWSVTKFIHVTDDYSYMKNVALSGKVVSYDNDFVCILCDESGKLIIKSIETIFLNSEDCLKYHEAVN